MTQPVQQFVECKLAFRYYRFASVLFCHIHINQVSRSRLHIIWPISQTTALLYSLLVVIRFSSAFYVDKITGLMRKSHGRKEVNYWVFVDIFDRTTWICITVSVVVLTISLSLQTWYYKNAGETVGQPWHVVGQLCRVLLALIQKDDSSFKARIINNSSKYRISIRTLGQL